MTLVLNAEMDHHLAGEEPGSRRNGYGRKTVITDTGQIELAVPRDREVRFDPQLIAKYQRRFPGFDDKIISMYARGMSTREIVGHLRDLYGIEVSPDLISAVTDAVLEEVAAWQARPLEAIYPLVFFDALRVKIRDEGLVRNKAVRIALGVRADGPASSICSATAWISSPGRTASPWRPRSRASTEPSTPLPVRRRSAPSKRASGAKNTRQSVRAGAEPGARSSRSMPFPATFDAFCTPQTPSKR